MKKPFKNTDMSDVTCSHPDCNEKLKKNLLAKNPNARFCYKHWLKQHLGKGKRNSARTGR